jgi:DNA-directed RNA polymerase specialized sigma24 family protein
VTSTPRDDPGAVQRPRVRPFLGVPDSTSHAVDPAPTGAAPPTEPGLRPFVLTSGRVTSLDPDVGLETQVTTRPAAELWVAVAVSALPPEQRAIVDLCVEPVSVAEISSRLGMHLGVTRVLVSDLRDSGYLDVHVADTLAANDPEIILRVMRGLRAIS